MFDDFDFKLLDDPDFKEDAVREELIAPLLKKLGYQPSGQTRVVRSKTLTHPFVRIGTRKHPVNIIPDYTLWHDDTALLILDAKSPKEDVLDPDHVQQAYSYAIHPEVRAKHFALCNGRQLAIFDVDKGEPVLVVNLQDVSKRWEEVQKHLHHRFLLNPALRNFLPDLGFAVGRMGMSPGSDFDFLDFHLSAIVRQNDTLYSSTSACTFGGRDYVATFDFAPAILDPILACLAAPLAVQVRGALSRAPFMAALDLMVTIDCTSTLGPPTPSEYEVFRPFLLNGVSASRLDRNAPDVSEQGIPNYIFSLKKAFETLQKGGK